MNVVFDEPEMGVASRPVAPPKVSLLSQLVMKTGIVKTSRAAQVVLAIIALVACIGVFVLWQMSMPEYGPIPGDPTAL